MHRERNTAIFAILIAVTIASVEYVFYLFRVEGNETKPVGYEFISEDGSVLVDFDEVDSHGGDFCKNGAA